MRRKGSLYVDDMGNVWLNRVLIIHFFYFHEIDNWSFIPCLPIELSAIVVFQAKLQTCWCWPLCASCFLVRLLGWTYFILVNRYPKKQVFQLLYFSTKDARSNYVKLFVGWMNRSKTCRHWMIAVLSGAYPRHNLH